MDSKEREARDHQFEEFVYDQVVRYGRLMGKISKVYIGCVVACIAMCVLGIVLGKNFFGALFIGLWSVGFLAAARFYKEESKDIAEDGKKIRAAIDDPDFDIPDDYPEDVLGIRALVCPTLKNVRAQAIAYGLIALTCWAGAVVVLWAATLDNFNPPIFIAAIVLGAMALLLSLLSIRYICDIPSAKAYEQYLTDVAND